MSSLPIHRVRIPPDWSAQQAEAVFEFLEEIAAAVWEAHDAKILETIKSENVGHQEVLSLGTNQSLAEDDIPF